LVAWELEVWSLFRCHVGAVSSLPSGHVVFVLLLRLLLFLVCRMGTSCQSCLLPRKFVQLCAQSVNGLHEGLRVVSFKNGVGHE
jgi:hypothetical protein